MKNYILLASVLLSFCSCISGNADPVTPLPDATDFSPEGLARIFSRLPMEEEHLQEVYNAVGHSSGNGYDEEYTMNCLVDSPGAGVGDSPQSRAASSSSYSTPLRDLLLEYLKERPGTRSGDASEMLNALAQSDFQLYWPYSENWDGKSWPIITFDPGYGAETNYGYRIAVGEDGARVVDSVFVDEALAAERPVWVFNNNSDARFTPLKLVDTEYSSAGTESFASSAPLARHRQLLMTSFQMKRNYDSWFGGASEFWLKCGSVEGFNAATDAELKLFYPSVTDFIIVVKRKYVGHDLPFQAILVGDYTSQLDKVVFMITEDDGGTRTSWKCDVMVKIQSKAYGLSVDLPYNEKDDIVWRGQLSTHFFEEEDLVRGRFGDVEVVFELT